MLVLFSGLYLQLCCEIDCLRADNTSLFGYLYHKMIQNKRGREKEITTENIELTGSNFVLLY